MLIHTHDPIDGSDDADVQVYPANFDPDKITADTFSARRLPDRVHYRMVRNTRTGCLRADPILDEQTILALYRQSRVTYEGLTQYTAATYRQYLDRALPHLPDRRGVLEIGCGNGFFLESLLPLGFGIVRGIEPSDQARASASADTQALILPGVLNDQTFEPDTFSLVCGFQVLDHLVSPNQVLAACRRVLAARGLMYWICHDIGAPLARALGRSCPMIDIEHVVLYDQRTIRLLFEKNGFEVLDVFGVHNRYPLGYWAHLAPLPGLLKAGLGRALRLGPLADLTLSANLGNLGIVARKTGT